MNTFSALSKTKQNKQIFKKPHRPKQQYSDYQRETGVGMVEESKPEGGGGENGEGD